MTVVRRTMVALRASAACLFGACAPSADGSPDLPRRPILYQSQAPGGTEDLRLLIPESGASRVLLYGDSVASRGLAAWSRDARRVAYIRESGTRDRLYVFEPQSGAHRRLGDGLPAAVMFPEWSPDGATIALSAGRTPSHVGIYLIDSETGTARSMRHDMASYRCPSWAPDGDRLVVASYARARSALLVLDTTGAILDTLLQSDTTYLDCPQWSPRGRQILFTVFHGSGVSGWERPAFHSNLAVISIQERRVQQLTQGAGLTNYGRWSPDGAWIVFQSDRAATPTTDPARAAQMLQNLEIYVMRRDGTELRRLTTNTHFDAHPSW